MTLIKRIIFMIGTLQRTMLSTGVILILTIILTVVIFSVFNEKNILPPRVQKDQREEEKERREKNVINYGEPLLNSIL